MGHLFILTPIIILLAVIMHKAWRKNPQNPTGRIFRNFLVVWVVCSAVMGAMAVFIGTAFAIGLSMAFGVPFLYLASAILISLPFVLYKRGIWVGRALSTVIALWAILFGIIIYANVTETTASFGPLAGFFSFIFENIAYVHLIGLAVIFVPLGIFFFREAAKSATRVARVQSVLIGIGLLLGGLSESMHAFFLNPTWFDIVDFGVPIGWLIITIAMFYPRFAKKPSAAIAQPQV